MKKNVYKSAVDKVAFDEELENKIMNYLSENIDEKEKEIRGVWKMKNKMKISVATVACTLLTVSAVSYAGVSYFRSTSHMDYGLTTQGDTSGENISTNINNSGTFDETSEHRNRMEKENAGFELFLEEKGTDKVNWTKKSVWKDSTPAYNSKDGKLWDVDGSVSPYMSTEYEYSKYETALKDAEMPNIMRKLMPQLKLTQSPVLKEHHTEENPTITSKTVDGNFDYKGKNISVELNKYLTQIENTGVSVITGIEKATNQREYKTQNDVVYKLSDNTNDKITKTTSVVSTGNYNLIIQFEGLSESEIHEILDNIDLSGLNMM